MFFSPTDENEFENISSDLKPNSSAGHDEVLPNILSTAIKAFLKPLTHIINCSLNTGIVPYNMKIAKITPVFKMNDKHDLINYRPYPYYLISPKYLKKWYIKNNELVTKSSILCDKQFGCAKISQQPWLYWRLLINFLR